MSFVGKRGACAVLIALLGSLSGCGGGGDSGPGDTVLLPQQSGTSAVTCPASDMTCTGDSVVQTDHGISVTASGVQVYAISTNDVLSPNPAPTLAYGLRPATGGMADVRISKAADGRLATVTLLLSKLGLSWDGKTERPLIIETFSPTQGRVQLDKAGLAQLEALPSFTDLNFFDFARKGAGGTQAHYANNIYFPRTEPVRCLSNNPGCPTVETTELRAQLGSDRLGVFHQRYLVIQGQHPHLLRGQPEREVACIVLDEEADEPLVRAQRGAVDAQRGLLGVVAVAVS